LTEPTEPKTSMRRRTFLTGAAAAAGAAALTGRERIAAATTGGLVTLPPPAQSGIDHIVLVMMENRSFDHFLGWLPGADGKQAGLTYTDRNGVAQSTQHLRTYQGCDHPDPDHSYEGGRVQFNFGACDGWLRSGANDSYSIGYYRPSDLAFYSQAATYWTAFDRYFSATMAETYPNRFYQHSAQSDRTHNSTKTATFPAIWDRLAEAGVTGKYYYSDVPFLALYGDKYLPISRSYSEFLKDCAAGTLPAVSYVDPRFLDEGSGTSGDDHPHADIRVGQDFLNRTYEAVKNSPNWRNTALIINYDEWGGFFDHVPPAKAPDVHDGQRLRGFRVPCLLISPRARRHHVGHRVYDHTSVLKMIEWRFGLPPLTVRDAAARNLAEALDFAAAPNLTAPTFAVPPFVGKACPPDGFADYEEWRALSRMAASLGFPIFS